MEKCMNKAWIVRKRLASDWSCESIKDIQAPFNPPWYSTRYLDTGFLVARRHMSSGLHRSICLQGQFLDAEKILGRHHLQLDRRLNAQHQLIVLQLSNPSLYATHPVGKARNEEVMQQNRDRPRLIHIKPPGVSNISLSGIGLFAFAPIHRKRRGKVLLNLRQCNRCLRSGRLDHWDRVSFEITEGLQRLPCCLLSKCDSWEAL